MKLKSKRQKSGVKLNKVQKKVTEINNQQLLKAKRTEELQKKLKEKLKKKSNKFQESNLENQHVLDRFVAKKKK